MAYHNKFRVRKGLFNKAILQQWHCYPEAIMSSKAGTCSWVDVNYKDAPEILRECEFRPGQLSKREVGDE